MQNGSEKDTIEKDDTSEIEEQTITFPNAIIGIGGAGKKLVYSLLSNEWILKKMLKPRRAGVSNYDIFIVDTAKLEEDEDLKMQKYVKNKKDSIRAKLQHIDGNAPKDLNINYLLLTKDMSLDGPYDLMGPDVIRDIKLGTGAEYWWFDPNTIGKDLKKKLDERESFDSIDFSGGVVRRRALGKAILYKAISTKILDVGLTSGGRVAMVVGLGGGTGSGIFIDYAKRLKRASPTIDITLFAILPTSNETEREKANGFASLCELEYMHIVGDRNLFRHVILLPMGPTEYSGQKDNENIMKEFHDAFAYTFVSYFNLDVNERLIDFREDYEYAPFIIATSCITRYNIETYRKAIHSFDSALLSKKNALIEEEKINSKLNIFLIKEDKKEKEDEKGEDDIYNLSSADNTLLVNRINDFIKLFFKDGDIINYFNNAGYNSVSIFYSAIVDAMNRSGNTNSASQIISNIINSVKVADSTLPKPRDDVDKPMKDIVINEFFVDINMAKLFSKINGISDEKCHDNTKKILRAIITKKIDSEIMLTNDDIDGLKRTISESTTNKTKFENDYKDYQELTDKQIKEAKERIISDIRIIIEKFKVIKSKEYMDGLKDRYAKLDSELIEYANNINKCKKLSDLEKINNDRIKRLVDDFNIRIITIDDKFDKDIILTATEDIKEYQKYRIMAGRGLSFIDIILKFFGIKTEVMKDAEKNETERTLFAIKINKKNAYTENVYNIDDKKNVIKKYSYGVDKKLDECIINTKQSVIDKICDGIRLRFEKDVGNDHKEKIQIAIKDDNIDTELEIILKDIIKYHEKIKKYKDDINNATLKLDNAQKKKEFSINVNNLYENFFGGIRSCVDKENDKQKHMNSFDIYRSNRPESDETNRNHYVFEIEPKKIFDVIGRNNIKQLMTAVKTEESNMLPIVNQTISKLFRTNYNGITHRHIIYGQTEGKWSASSVILCMSSLKNNINIDRNEKIMMIKDQFKVDNVVYWPLEVGDDWDVCSTLFISGIFLDNIAEISSPVQGHYPSYRKLKERMGKLIFLHHTYLLENGQFLSRKLLSLENETIKKLFATGKPDEITGELLKLYETTSYVDQSNDSQDKG